MSTRRMRASASPCGASFTLESLLIRFDRRGIGPHLGPSTRDGDAVTHSEPRRADGVVRPIELPPAVVPYTNAGTVTPVLRRFGAQETALTARPYKREHLVRKHRRVVRIASRSRP